MQSAFLDPTTGTYPPPFPPADTPGVYEVGLFYGTNVPGVGFANPRGASGGGSYLSSTPVVDDVAHLLEDPLAPIVSIFKDATAYNYAAFAGQPGVSWTTFFYNPHAIPVAVLCWLASPDPELLQPSGSGLDGPGLYSIGPLAGSPTATPHASQGGVDALSSGPHVPSGGGIMGYHPVGGTEFITQDYYALGVPGKPYLIHGPDQDDPLRPIPTHAQEFLLNPGCCYPISVLSTFMQYQRSFTPDRPYAHTHDVRLVYLRQPQG